MIGGSLLTSNQRDEHEAVAGVGSTEVLNSSELNVIEFVSVIPKGEGVRVSIGKEGSFFGVHGTLLIQRFNEFTQDVTMTCLRTAITNECLPFKLMYL